MTIYQLSDEDLPQNLEDDEDGEDGDDDEPGVPPPPDSSVVLDRLELSLPPGAQVLVTSDLHLRPVATAGSLQIEQDLMERLRAWQGPGAVVLNGDFLELWGEPDATVARILDAHPDLTVALHDFSAGPGRDLVVIVGNHDAAIAWDRVSASELASRLGATCALEVDLVFDTPAGRRVVRCEHGHAFDPANAFSDPRNPLDSPLGQHIVQQVLPEVTRTPLLADLVSLADPNAAGRFLASRLVYRQLGRRIWWLLAPLSLALLLRIPLVVRVLSRSDEFGHLPRWVLIGTVGLLVDAGLVLLLVMYVARALYAAMASSRMGPRGSHANGAPRTAAASLCGPVPAGARPDEPHARALAGLITGHTHQPELTPVPGGFYANSGCGLRCLEARATRFGLPPVFAPVLRRSWVELDVEQDLRVRLVVAESPTGELTRLERLVCRGRATAPPEPTVVATLPGQAGWPLRPTGLQARPQLERTRRAAALAVVAVALLGLVSALTLPTRPRLRGLLEALPVEVPQTAAASAVFASVALLLLARGLHRGRSVAWGTTLALLLTTAVLHLLKGIDLEEAVVSAAVAGWLVWRRLAFAVHPDSRHLRRAVAVGAGAALLVGVLSTVLVLTTGERNASGETARAVAERLVGDRALPLPSTSPFLTPALIAAGFSMLLAVGWLLTRPRLRRLPTANEHRADLAHARRLVAEHGGDTLTYFALRDDKSWFFTGDCVVAYTVRAGVCLVSPDPVGPAEQWPDAWAEFTAFTDRHGWSICVLGAGAGWLPIYQQSGLRPLYIGDEAIVDCAAFTLEGRPMKGLRSGYHRVQRAGYAVHFYDPASIPQRLADELRDLMGESRQGEVERGFSMTLSRVFDPADADLLLAVATGPHGRAAGFCQFVPAQDISGWSLDLMRRSADPDLPNGLTDYILIETINHLKARGEWGLGLNFAVMRAVLAGEAGESLVTDLERRVLHRFSDSMQIESLWRYNDKYRPYWRPRYAVLAGIGRAPTQALVMAEAEGVAELPLIGRFIRRRQRAEQSRAEQSSPSGSSPSADTVDSTPDTTDR